VIDGGDDLEGASWLKRSGRSRCNPDYMAEREEAAQSPSSHPLVGIRVDWCLS